MRVHVHNPPTASIPLISPQVWEEACARAGLHHEVSFGADRESFQRALAEGAEAVITADARIRDWLDTPAPKLRAVSMTFAGLDNMAPFGWLPPGVALLNNAGTHALKAGEFVMMSLLMLANRMPRYATDQRAGAWQPVRGHILRGRRMTVLGTGAIGGRAAHLARQFGLHVTGVRATGAPHPDCDRVVRTAELDGVLPDTEFLVIAAPLTAQTHKLVNRARLSLLPRQAGVINVGRGPVLDQEALCDLLDSGHLSGAILDVFDAEPVPPGDRLWTAPGLVITPHISAADPALFIPTSLDIFLANLAALARGEAMPNRFDLARGY